MVTATGETLETEAPETTTEGPTTEAPVTTTGPMTDAPAIMTTEEGLESDAPIPYSTFLIGNVNRL